MMSESLRWMSGGYGDLTRMMMMTCRPSHQERLHTIGWGGPDNRDVSVRIYTRGGEKRGEEKEKRREDKRG